MGRSIDSEAAQVQSDAIRDHPPAERTPGGVRQNGFATFGARHATVGQGERDARGAQALFAAVELAAANIVSDLQSVRARGRAGHHDAEK